MAIEMIKDRLLRFIAMENMSSTQFADALGVQRSTVSHLLSGRNNPSYDFIVRILNSYKYLSADWLLCGVGEMYRQQDEHMGNLFSQPASHAQDVPSPPSGAAEHMPEPEMHQEPASARPSGADAPTSPAPEAATPATRNLSAPDVSWAGNQPGRAIERIVIFYNDKSMEIYES